MTRFACFILALLCLFAATGCSSTQHGPVRAELGSAIKPNYAVMEVFYATDRKMQASASVGDRYTGERGTLSYGSAFVSIPRQHRMGVLESPSIMRLEFRPDPEKHVVLLDIRQRDKGDYFSRMKSAIASSPRKTAFIFVHGYNVTFEDATRRTAQLSYDLGFKGAAVMYSWPSQGSTLKYTVDEDNIAWSETHLTDFLEDFCRDSDASDIYLIGHSMGTRGLTRAYVALLNKQPALKSRFKEIILAAPDIDAEVFMQNIAPAMVASNNPVTLYASSKDIPLQASKVVHDNRRAGDSGKDIVILQGIDSIDSSNISTEFLGHSYFAGERSMIQDIFQIIQNAQRPAQRGLESRHGPRGSYWAFQR